MDNDVVARFRKPSYHGRAHTAEPNEPKRSSLQSFYSGKAVLVQTAMG
ncbi:hypothetical protein MPL1032_30339 [Mesorhizobium plurifarium]|uniref:Uncharacterized protein n=1 Tax=Mesorhizobium plurifarium TaxID=69974 RepID=A0A0K2W409_MESPL|nr:hypothetical protein MPL1032_30339 [Mesorhizobium plurifarium]